MPPEHHETQPSAEVVRVESAKLAVLGAAASGPKLRLREFTFARCAVGANACVSFFLGRCTRGGCKWSETAIARIYVRSLCRCAVAPMLA